jgi:hypothetical protein
VALKKSIFYATLMMLLATLSFPSKEHLLEESVRESINFEDRFRTFSHTPFIVLLFPNRLTYSDFKHDLHQLLSKVTHIVSH